MLHLIFAAAPTIDGSPVSRKERNLQSASRSDQWIRPRGIGVQTIPVRVILEGHLYLIEIFLGAELRDASCVKRERDALWLIDGSRGVILIFLPLLSADRTIPANYVK
jgi:hypothetical protein